jgi:multicomponent Na+:H+ antiporter subunit B
MNSTILQIAQRYVRLLLLLFAVIALLRGHNFPGGGFIGGLLAGLSIVMKGFAFDIERVREEMRITPVGFLTIGLTLIAMSMVPSLVTGEAFMQGFWIKPELPFIGEIKLGTPLLFDMGVFFAVIGVAVLFLFSLKKED